MPHEVRVLLDLPFHTAPTVQGTRTLVLDLWLPAQAVEPTPLIVYIHGGAWSQGTQYRPPFRPRFYDQGIAIAAITYRFCTEMPFPAMLFDCKTAVRWLRAHAEEYNFDPDRFGAWGISAGGHLAALLGVTNNLPEWEGDGPCQEFSSVVCAVCDWCGPTDLVRTLTDPAPGDGMVDLVSCVVGGPLAENLERARAASPTSYIGKQNPPHLIVHGAQDPLVAPWHATVLYEAMQAAGVDVALHMLPDMGHDLDSPETERLVNDFFNRTLHA
jgi:acetyl esterase/lipase